MPGPDVAAGLPYSGSALPVMTAAGSCAPSAAAVPDPAAGCYEIRLSGSGGQGLILAAVILAEAAVSRGKEVVQSQSYGPEARGGASQAAVIISDDEIDYPEVEAADLTLCLSQPAFDKFAPQTRPGGLVLYDSGLVVPGSFAGARLIGLPFTQTARRRAGTPMAANVVSLGAIVALLPAVDVRRWPPASASACLRRSLKRTSRHSRRAPSLPCGRPAAGPDPAARGRPHHRSRRRGPAGRRRRFRRALLGRRSAPPLPRHRGRPGRRRPHCLAPARVRRFDPAVIRAPVVPNGPAH